MLISRLNKLLSAMRTALSPYGWKGSYASWDEAKKHSTGYDNELILDRVARATQKVKNGEAAFERDSVLFAEPDYPWQLLSVVMWVAAQHKGRLHVIDFGGSLGSTYYQNRLFLDALPEVHWNIIEQEGFVRTGKASFSNERLQFYYNIGECIAAGAGKPHIIVLSSVLQYLDEPYKILEEICSAQVQYIYFDRTAFVMSVQDELTVQVVPPSIYKASYPAWFFAYEPFIQTMQQYGYQLLSACYNDEGIIAGKYHFKGLLFRKNGNSSIA